MIAFFFLSNQIVFNEMGLYCQILNEFVEIIYRWMERGGITFSVSEALLKCVPNQIVGQLKLFQNYNIIWLPGVPFVDMD